MRVMSVVGVWFVSAHCVFLAPFQSVTASCDESGGWTVLLNALKGEPLARETASDTAVTTHLLAYTTTLLQLLGLRHRRS
jgi:hypothetical protein